MFRFQSKRVFAASITIVCAGCFLLNWKHTANHGLLIYYQAFADYIASGFSAVPSVPTFPMWGYGWVWWLTGGSVPVILLVQFALCLISTWLFVRFVEKTFPDRGLRWLRPIVVFSIPWYMFHAVLQPNVIAADLWILAIVFFLGRSSRWSVVLSGVCAGLALNLRSDFILLPLVLTFVWWWAGRHQSVIGFTPFHVNNRLTIRPLIGWIAIIALTLAPWSYHYWRTTERFGLTSSNRGHVLFIGLGQMPGNPWGRTCSDGDQQMATILAETFGVDTIHSCSHEASGILLRAFVQDIQRHPLGYVKRCLYTFAHGITGGFYQGEILSLLPQKQHAVAREYKSTLQARLGISSDTALRPADVPVMTKLVVMFQLGLSVYARTMLFLGTASALVLLFLWRRIGANLLIITAITVVAYQQIVCVIVYANPMYFSGSYMFYILCLAVMLHYIGNRQFRRRRPIRGVLQGRTPEPV